MLYAFLFVGLTSVAGISVQKNYFWKIWYDARRKWSCSRARVLKKITIVLMPRANDEKLCYVTTHSLSQVQSYFLPMLVYCFKNKILLEKCVLINPPYWCNALSESWKTFSCNNPFSFSFVAATVCCFKEKKIIWEKYDCQDYVAKHLS